MKISIGKPNNLPMIVVILDGWGIARPNKGNATTLAKTPVYNEITKKFPFTELFASSRYVGLPPHQAGNSEAGHMNIGAGRIVEQDAVKISKSINNGTFYKNAAFNEAIRHAKKNNTKVHLMGMISNGMSAHSDPDHLIALLTMLAKRDIKKVCLHLFTDGRDSPKYASLKLIQDIEKIFNNNECIASIIGRFYAMDRKKIWGRTAKAYNALVYGLGRKADSAQAAITECYNRGESDEFIEPYVITKNGKITPRISEGDSVIFFNLRSDRARQLAKTFVQKNFCENNNDSNCSFRKKILDNLRFITMTDFGPDLDSILTAFPSEDIKQTLPMQLGNLRQLYIAETEKYAHVTYFLNGGYANPVAGEARTLIPSPNVKIYDRTPAMSSEKLTNEVIANIKIKKYDFTFLNFAAPDMIGHTGNLKAGIKCCQLVDGYLGMIIKAYLNQQGTVIVTADHGNIEEMINLKTGEIDTQHSSNPVPFVIINKRLQNKIKFHDQGILGDIAPTVLELLDYNKPGEMNGKSLIK